MLVARGEGEWGARLKVQKSRPGLVLDGPSFLECDARGGA